MLKNLRKRWNGKRRLQAAIQRQVLKSILIIAMPVALLFLCYSCEKWKYEECKKVGHGTLYCVIKIGEER